MKKRAIFSGLLVVGVAFSAAAFTAKKNTTTFHYLQKPTECTPIPETGCVIPLKAPCFGTDDGVNFYRVHLTQISPEECETPLHLP